MFGIVSFIFGAIEVIIGLRFIFQVLGANTASPIVTWIYDVSSPLVAPFTAIFGHATTAAVGLVTRSVFEPATLIALIVYGLIGGLIMRLMYSAPHRI